MGCLGGLPKPDLHEKWPISVNVYYQSIPFEMASRKNILSFFSSFPFRFCLVHGKLITS